MGDSAWTAVEMVNRYGRSPFVLVCEHAALAIPEELDALGLAPEARDSHAAWDIGARDVAVALAEGLDAPLVAGTLSRLVYDCNRPPEAHDAVPAQSEVIAVPGNRDLDAAARAQRVALVHDPFHAAVEEVAAGRAALVTIHSFTPVYHGQHRAVELGFLCHHDESFARAALEVEAPRGRYRAALNEPYAASDGVTYTLRRHGDDAGRPAVMIEIRNDLIATAETARAMAAHLQETLTRAWDALGQGAGGVDRVAE
ncbi:N-formylglutamate amidohydrolase [Roseivivax sediminis]|uniref:Predicted N-formylglutamate amidohydrolase n=1 Tax=Roseivivax sediminis TaxID=936889 RepID=A0A1I1Z9A8_9RHOB|nr:N-formylglutamate amidohydrolase [Roseivivax sediminis]SFE27083.1 Predicted N-formylglutamate amidohydrolase [Roseivivax sediminis]